MLGCHKAREPVWHQIETLARSAFSFLAGFDPTCYCSALAGFGGSSAQHLVNKEEVAISPSHMGSYFSMERKPCVSGNCFSRTTLGLFAAVSS